MTKAAHPPFPDQEAPGYPTTDTARGYAENLRIGAPGAAYMSKERSFYRLSTRLDIVVVLLQTNIYAVVALPPGDAPKANAGQLNRLDYFRGWLFKYDRHHARWSLLAQSIEVDVQEFMHQWQEIKGA